MQLADRRVEASPGPASSSQHWKNAGFGVCGLGLSLFYLVIGCPFLDNAGQGDGR
jgi:hypothetical protein